MESIMRKLIRVIVEECGSKYGFDVEEAISSMCVSVSGGGSKLSVVRRKSSKVVERYPMPFNGEKNEGQCLALRQNSGLYTQCKMSNRGERYCKSCEQLASKSVDGIPEYGTIEQRQAVDIFDYVDPKGRKPISYTKIMKKNKLTKEDVLEEASRLGITIDARHFEVPEEAKRGRPITSPKEPKEAKGKGRPKKTNKVVQIEETEDLFASLVASACSNNEEKIEEEKIEKIEKEEKIEKADKAAKLEAQKAEKEAKLEAQKADKEAKLAAQKEAKLATKKEKKQPKTEPKSEAKSEPKEEPEETYKKCGEVNGKKYIRSQQTGIVYDFDKYTETEELYPVGKWNAEKKEIMFTNDEDSELSDDEIDDE